MSKLTTFFHAEYVYDHKRFNIKIITLSIMIITLYPYYRILISDNHDINNLLINPLKKQFVGEGFCLCACLFVCFSATLSKERGLMK